MEIHISMQSLLLFAGSLISSAFLQGQVMMTDAVETPSRGEVVMTMILSRTPDVPVTRNTGQFRDLPKGHAHETYMLYAEKLGIIRADPQGNLFPESPVTRAEFLKMLTFTFGMSVNYPYGYTDVPRDAWYEPYAGLAAHYRLFSLTPLPNLIPTRPVTRQDLSRAISIMSRKDDPAALELEQRIAQEQTEGKLQLYTVISSRMQKVTLIMPETADTVVRTITLPPSLPEMRTEILDLVNAVRRANGLGALTYNAALESSAQEYANRMAHDGFFGHTDPQGKTLRDRVAATGYYDRTFNAECMCVKGYSIGENLGRGQKTPVEVMADWMDSPSHREAIMNPDYTDLGIGVTSGIWVQHFGGVLELGR